MVFLPCKRLYDSRLGWWLMFNLQQGKTLQASGGLLRAADIVQRRNDSTSRFLLQQLCSRVLLPQPTPRCSPYDVTLSCCALSTYTLHSDVSIPRRGLGPGSRRIASLHPYPLIVFIPEYRDSILRCATCFISWHP